MAAVMREMLSSPDRLDAWGRSAQRRAHDHFLIYTQLRQWLRLIAEVA
ncbi:MAG: hypothetical protein WEF86_06175 [Gemmatimonadota bacterium]